jgi:hypothetical protein
MKTFRWITSFLSVCVTLVTVSVSLPAGAAGAVSAENNTPESWHFTVSPVFGVASFRGNGAVGPLAGHLKVSFHNVMKDSRFAAASSLEAGRGPWIVWLSSQYFDLSQDMHLGQIGGWHTKAHATQAVWVALAVSGQRQRGEPRFTVVINR